MCINANVINENELNYWVGEANSKNNWLPSTCVFHKIITNFRLALIILHGELSIIDLDKSKFNPHSYGPDAEIAIFDLRVLDDFF